MKIFLIASVVPSLLLVANPFVEAAKETFDRSKPHVNVGVLPSVGEGGTKYDFSDTVAVTFETTGIVGSLTLKRGLIKSSSHEVDGNDFILWQRNSSARNPDLLDICVKVLFGPPEEARDTSRRLIKYRLMKGCAPEMVGEEVNEVTGEAYEYVTASCSSITEEEMC